MPNHSSFDQEATLEELAGIGKNRRFDEVVDDGANESIQVYCKQGDEVIPLAKPSRAFYFGDRNLYEQEAKRFDQDRKARILSTDLFVSNLRVFEELKRACQRGFVIPFVGAGMSKNAGCPDWRAYLLQQCGNAGLDIETIRHRLDNEGDFEGVMDDVVTHLTANVFERDFERDFAVRDQISGALTLLPKLFDNSAITTNFDRVLEKVYEASEKAFSEKVMGRGNTNSFFRAIPAGERYLLKLHGNVDNATERVLNKAEYNSAYGNAGDVHFDFPIPKLLKRLFASYSFLFLGCSLTYDRTIQTFTKVAQDLGQDNLPHHYALLSRPNDPEEIRKIDQRLANAHITPLWYPDGDYDRIEEILNLLLES